MQKWVIIFIAVAMGGIFACGSGGDVQQREWTVDLDADHDVDIDGSGDGDSSLLPPGDPHDLEELGDDVSDNDRAGRVDADDSEGDDLEDETTEDDDHDVVIEPLGFHTNNLEAGVAGVAYRQEVSMFGGSGECRWNATGLPRGLSLEANGCGASLEGVPRSGGISSVHVEACDLQTTQCISTDFELEISFNILLRLYRGEPMPKSGRFRVIEPLVKKNKGTTIDIPYGEVLLVIAEAFGRTSSTQWSISSPGLRQTNVEVSGLKALPDGRSRWAMVALEPSSPPLSSDQTFKDVRIAFRGAGEEGGRDISSLHFLADPCRDLRVVPRSSFPQALSKDESDLTLQEGEMASVVLGVQGGVGPFRIEGIQTKVVKTPYKDCSLTSSDCDTVGGEPLLFSHYRIPEGVRLSYFNSHSLSSEPRGRLMVNEDSFFEDEFTVTVTDEGCEKEVKTHFHIRTRVPWAQFEQIYRSCEGSSDVPVYLAHWNPSLFYTLSDCTCPKSATPPTPLCTTDVLMPNWILGAGVCHNHVQCTELIDDCVNQTGSAERLIDNGEAVGIDVIAHCRFVQESWQAFLLRPPWRGTRR